VLVRGLWDCTANLSLSPEALTGTEQGFGYLIAWGFWSLNHGTHGTHGTHGNGPPSAFRSVKWVCDPFLDERDRFVTYTHGLGGPCYGWKKPGDGPSPSHYQMYPGDFVEPVANGEGINQAPVGRCVWALIGSGTPLSIARGLSPVSCRASRSPLLLDRHGIGIRPISLCRSLRSDRTQVVWTDS
jgi:hypothetical protein